MTRTLQITALLVLSLLFIRCGDDEAIIDLPAEPETVTDADGNVYQTITLGNQTWMLENLKTATFNDGTPIMKWVFGESWYNVNTPVQYYQWASTSDLNNLYEEDLPEDFYGAQYNEFALTSGKLAPEGWAIPTRADFEELESFLANDGHTGNQANVLKSATGWVDDLNGTDVYGFNILPNGYVAAGGTATGSQVIATYATTDTNEDESSRTVVNFYQEPTFSFADNSKALGAGVRCIKRE